jgi:hypothetical protein
MWRLSAAARRNDAITATMAFAYAIVSVRASW